MGSQEDDAARVVIVTGAAGELGRSIVAEMCRAGNRVAALDRSDRALADAATFWAEAGVTDYVPMIVDQTDPTQVAVAVDMISQVEGPIRGLVANAGYAKFGGLLEMPVSTWDRHVAVNLSGTFYMCQAVAQSLAAARSGGWITVISSNLATRHADQVGAYCVTKSALLAFVTSAAAELGAHRIRVNAVCPGVIETGMTRGMLEKPGTVEGLIGSTPLGRLGHPADVSAAIRFLASDEAAWVTGATLLVDGGQSIYGQPAWIKQDRTVPHEPQWVEGYPAAATPSARTTTTGE